MNKLFYAFSAVVLAALATSAQAESNVPDPSYASFIPKMPCVMRIGRCFEARIAGQAVVAIKTEKEYKDLYRYAKEKNSSVRDLMYWQVLQPIDGKKVFDIALEANELGKALIGEQSENPTIGVYPLQAQAIETKAELVASKTVRVGGNAVVSEQQTMTDDELPPGEYVIAITYQGQNRQFDRKHVFVRVK